MKSKLSFRLNYINACKTLPPTHPAKLHSDLNYLIPQLSQYAYTIPLLYQTTLKNFFRKISEMQILKSCVTLKPL